MLTMPEFQASAVRLEILQHLAVANTRGKLSPRPCALTSWLNTLGEGWAGRMEDPAEDVFVSRVSNIEQDFLMFEGLYESSAFYLQRFLNVLDEIPSQEPFARLRRSAHALLMLSDKTVKRSGISPFTVGNTVPIDEVEYATLSWVHWFNHKRLLEPIGDMPPVEKETMYYQQLEGSAEAA